MTQKAADRFDHLRRLLRDINPRETEDSPTVEQRLAITFPVSGEGIGQFVPPSRVPLNGQACRWIRGIESTLRVPRNGELKFRLRQAPDPKHLGSPSFERRPVSRSELPPFDDRPDLLDSRFAASSYLTDNLFDLLNADSLIGNRRLDNGRKVSGCEERR